MNCPRDGARLVAASFATMSLEKCPACGGLWLDYEELAQLVDLGWSKVEAYIQECDETDGDPSPSATDYMRCPRCDAGRLQGFHYTFTRPVRIDRCDTCLGFWLDCSELDAILAEKLRLDDYELEVDRLLDDLKSERP